MNFVITIKARIYIKFIFITSVEVLQTKDELTLKKMKKYIIYRI